MRVKIIHNTRRYRQGQVINVSRNVAFGLIDSGKAVLSKDMTEQDYTTRTKRGK